ncbi:MAG: diguanylate cyclase/phosphodiesterase [Rhodocyclaceae bacterium]|nr:diguanylate cyclase/phosphodiesterase [Rhodocyclaceae bacterium]
MTEINLRRRLLLLSLLPSALLAVVLVAYFVFSGMRALEGELRERGMAVVRYLAPVSEYGLIAGHLENLQGLAQTTVQQPGVKAAVVVGRSGHILAVSGRVSLSSEQLKRMPGEPGIIADNEQWIAFGAPVLRNLAESDDLFDPAGAKTAPEVIGHVFVEFDKGEFQERQHTLVRRGIIIIAIGLLLMAVVALAIADGITRPVTRLVHAVRSMGLGHFDTRVKNFSFGEFRELEQGFNDMAARISEVHQTMQERIEGATAQLAFQARHDALTGLVNRREFEARLERTIAAIQAGGEEGSLLFVDLDRFKVVNDTCGHSAGDELLRQISRLLQGRLRDEDTLARIGGDEFGILLSNCIGSRALQVAEDLCTLTGAYRFIWQDKIFSIGASIGLTPLNRQVRDVAEALAAGDAACYLAKEKGRNRVHVQLATQAQNRRQADRSWHDRIVGALADHHLVCDALPMRPFRAGAEDDHFVEICVRLDDHVTPTIPSSMLLEAAERYDLATAIDRHLLETAMAALSRADAHGRRMRCLLPLSATSVRHSQTIELLSTALSSHSIPAASLYLLISEECAVQHATEAVELCTAARALGCRIALGDFGGGFASFGHLRNISPDCVKISHSLTRNIDGNRSARALIRAIKEIADDLGMESIADGVDDLATFNVLQELGITYAQGRAAAPGEPFEDWIEGAVIR